MIYELRIYTVVPGRIPDIETRFRDHLPALFERHGIDNVGRWKGLSGPGGPVWVYMMVYDDLAERTKRWASFYADQDWWSVRAATNAGEEMVERYESNFLSPNPAWVPEPFAWQAGSVDELLLIEVALGKKAAADAYIEATLIPAIRAQSGCVAMVADFITGVCLPRLALMVSWKDADAWRRGTASLLADPTLSAVFRNQRSDVGTSLLGRTETWVLQAGDGAPPSPLLGYRHSPGTSAVGPAWPR